MLFMLLSPGSHYVAPKQTIVLEKTEEYDPQKKPTTQTTCGKLQATRAPRRTRYKNAHAVFAVIFVVLAAYIETSDFVDKWFFSTKL